MTTTKNGSRYRVAKVVRLPQTSGAHSTCSCKTLPHKPVWTDRELGWLRKWHNECPTREVRRALIEACRQLGDRP